MSPSWADPDDAIRIATGLGIPLKIAAKVDKVDESYFREVVEPMLSPFVSNSRFC